MTRPGPNNRVISYVAAAAIGLIVALWIFPTSTLRGTDEASRYPVVDRGQAITGARYFVGDDWHWPLLKTDDLGTPDGAIVAYTDSIPVMAVAAKVLRPLGAGPNYFGYWIVITFVAQAVGAVYVLRGAKVERLGVLAMGAFLSVLVPAFLYRTVHPALSGHFVILFALGAALRTRYAERIRPYAMVQSATAILALLIHPYLFLMVALIVIGSATEIWIAVPDRRRQLMTWAAATGLALGVVLVAGGYLVSAGTQTEVEGFGLYSMDIASPIVPQLSGLIGERRYLDATGGQREGYNYQGLGVLLLVGAALLLRTIRPGEIWKRDPGLVVAVGAMALFAPSATLYFWGRGPLDVAQWINTEFAKPAGLVGLIVLGLVGWRQGARRASELALRYAPILLVVAVFGLFADRFISQFRASGRFFWPLGYVILLAGLVGLDRLGNRAAPAAIGLGLLAVGLQIVDTAPARVVAFENATDVGAGHFLPPRLWESLIEGHSLVTVSPVIECGSFPLGIFRGLELTTAASVNLVPVSTSKLARNEPTPCPGEPSGVAPAEGELIVYTEPLELDLPLVGALLDDPSQSCRWSDDVVACTNNWEDQEGWVTAEFRRPVGQPARFDAFHDDTGWVGLGWGEPDERGRLMTGAYGEIMFPIPEATNEDLLLSVTLELIGAGTSRSAEVFVGDESIGVIGPFVESRAKHVLVVPAELVSSPVTYFEIVPLDGGGDLKINSAWLTTASE